MAHQALVRFGREARALPAADVERDAIGLAMRKRRVDPLAPGHVRHDRPSCRPALRRHGPVTAVRLAFAPRAAAVTSSDKEST